MTQTQQILHWQAMMLADVDSLIKTGNHIKHPKHTPGQKMCTGLMCMVPCIGCFLWSAVWRIMWCPCACFKGGASNVCTNNGCTECSDRAMMVVVKELDARKDVNNLLKSGAFADPGVLRRQSRIPGAVQDAIVCVLNAIRDAAEQTTLESMKLAGKYALVDMADHVIKAISDDGEFIHLTAANLHFALGNRIASILQLSTTI